MKRGAFLAASAALAATPLLPSAAPAAPVAAAAIAFPTAAPLGSPAWTTGAPFIASTHLLHKKYKDETDSVPAQYAVAAEIVGDGA